MITREEALAVLAEHEAQLAARLRASQARVEDCRTALREARRARAAVVEEALDDGWTQANVGRAMGITRQYVAQIRGGIR